MNYRALGLISCALQPCLFYCALQPYYIVVIMFFLHLVSMQSYFGGVCCVCWSPDGRYIAAGGEDDLVSIYGMAERGVVAWGEGHSSWVMQVAFDPW